MCPLVWLFGGSSGRIRGVDEEGGGGVKISSKENERDKCTHKRVKIQRMK